MDIITIIGYIGIGLSAGLSIYYMFKFNELKALKNTISNLKEENKSLSDLLSVKNQVIDQFNKDIADLKTQVNTSKIIFEGKFNDLNRKIDLLTKENELHRIDNLSKEVTIVKIKEATYKAIEHCEIDNCPVCEEITNVINKYK